MKHFLLRALFSVVLLASAVQARAGVSYGASPAFSFDTRDYLAGLAAESAPFTFDTRAVNGLSGASSSGLFSFDTRTVTLTGVNIFGPSNALGGTYSSYTATAYFSDGSQQDVTKSASWSFTTNTPGAFMDGNRLFGGYGTGLGVGGLSVRVPLPYGTYPSTPFAIGLPPATRITISQPEITPLSQSGNNVTWRVQSQASISGGSPVIERLQWQWNGKPIGTAGSASLDVNLTDHAGTGILSVEVPDTSVGLSFAKATLRLTLEKPPVTNEPLTRLTEGDVTEGVYLDENGQTLDWTGALAAAGKGNGLIVLTHGVLLGDSDAEGERLWLKDMARAIRMRLVAERRSVPLIVLYDWTNDATPSRNVDAVSRRVYLDGVRVSDTIKTMTAWAFAEGFRNFAILTPWLADALYAIERIRILGPQHGTILARRLKAEFDAGHLNSAMPIHLIGHSAGGFVVGECAQALRAPANNIQVALTTMLDTPFPFARHFKNANANNRVERYISSKLSYGDATAPELDNAPRQFVVTSSTEGTTAAAFIPTPAYKPNLAPSASYHLAFTDSAPGWPTIISDHAYAHEWYVRTIGGPSWPTSLNAAQAEENGFYYSPFLGNRQWQSVPTLSGFAPGGFTKAQTGNPPAQSLTGFETFGNVQMAGGTYTITEQANAGIFCDVVLPIGIQSLTFRYQFTTPGDGDFLAVSFADSPVLFIGLDSDLSRQGPASADVWLGRFAGETGRLTIKLVSRNAANAEVILDSISLTVSDDPDGDGLTTEQELLLGTDPLAYDTDGDGLSDGEEVSVYRTNPALADSDGDGQPDAAEIAAGTNPMDSHSVFALTEFSRAGGGFLLRWSALSGKTYRILRSTTPDFASFDVIASGLVGVAPTTTYNDTGISTVTTPAAFYRIEVE